MLLRKISTTVAGLLLLALPVQADQAVGASGQVLRTLTGTYGELFPEGVETSADSHVLALEITANGSTRRWLVPGTESIFEEFSPSLVHDSSSEITYLIWEGVHNGVHPLLYLRSFDGTTWSGEIELSGSPFSRKGHPQLAINRDRSIDPSTNLPIDRTVVHVAWWEEQGGVLSKRYTPLVLEAGRFLGAHPVLGLDQMAAQAPTATVLLGETLKVQPGPQSGSALVGLVNSGTAELLTVEAAVVPQGLSRLAAQIEEFIARQDSSISLQDLSTLVNVELNRVGSFLAPATLDFFRASLMQLLATVDPVEVNESGMTFLGSRAGANIVIIGYRSVIDGPAADGSTKVIRISGPGTQVASHHVSLRRLGTWALPEAPEGAQFYFSRRGLDATVAWDGENKVYYRETLGGAWSEMRTIDLTQTLDRASALAILERRTLDR
jgi:hypothetical protein